MDADEKDICDFLKNWPRQFISGREIARRAAGKRRFREEPYWANQPLLRLLEKRVIETDANGHYRILPEEKKAKVKRWVSPEIKKILEESGKDFDIAADADSSEEPQSGGSAPKPK